MGGDFYQIQSDIPGQVAGFLNGNHTLIVTILIDQTNFAGSNPIVYAVICGYGLPRPLTSPL